MAAGLGLPISTGDAAASFLTLVLACPLDRRFGLAAAAVLTRTSDLISTSSVVGSKLFNHWLRCTALEAALSPGAFARAVAGGLYMTPIFSW